MATLAYIVDMKLWETQNSKSPMWICGLTNGETTNVFKHADENIDTFHLFEDAGYSPEMLEMEKEQTIKWATFPICVEIVSNTTKKGTFKNVVRVFPRPSDAIPDSTFKPSPELARAESVSWAEMINTAPARVCYLDCETDSLDTDADLISIGIKTVYPSVLAPNENYETYIKPPGFARLTRAGKNGKSAADVTGIMPEDLQDKPSLHEVYHELYRRLNGAVWVIYNADFDAPIITAAFIRAGLTPPVPLGVHCAMKRLAQYNGQWDLKRSDWKWCTLTAAAEQFGVVVTNAHNALSDVETTYQIVKKMFWDEAAPKVGVWDVTDKDERP